MLRKMVLICPYKQSEMSDKCMRGDQVTGLGDRDSASKSHVGPVT
jgi:hypothetical protein